MNKQFLHDLDGLQFKQLARKSANARNGLGAAAQVQANLGSASQVVSATTFNAGHTESPH